MRDKCFEIGTIQAFLDGELASDVSENIARHLSLCDDCALLLAEAEEETAFAYFGFGRRTEYARPDSAVVVED